jgi:hypothetical protein
MGGVGICVQYRHGGSGKDENHCMSKENTDTFTNVFRSKVGVRMSARMGSKSQCNLESPDCRYAI